MKASDISDEQIYEIIRRKRKRFEFGRGWSWVFTRDIVTEFPEFPPKVVIAKLCQMVNKKRLKGCGCGKCRGDYELPEHLDN